MGVRHSAFCFAAVLVLCPLSGDSAARTYRSGDDVVVIADAKLILGDSEVGDVWPGRVLNVQNVNGNQLLVSKDKPGWLDQRHVIPVDRAAIEQLTTMIHANPGDAELYSGRAFVWEKLGDFDRAISDHDEAIRLNPSFAPYYNNRGFIWLAKGEFDRAMADYDEAVRLDPNIFVHGNRGQVWFAMGEFDRAISDFNVVLNRDPKDTFTYGLRGLVWHAKGEYDRAISDYTEVLKFDPKSATTYYYRSLVWYSKGDYDRAIADCNEAMLLNPKSRYGLIHRYLAMRAAGDTATADKLSPANSPPDDSWPSPLVRLIRGEIDEADLMALADDEKKQNESHCLLGLTYSQTGHRSKAMPHLHWVRDHGNKASVPYAMALGELRRLENVAD